MKNLKAFIIAAFAILIVGTATANAATWTVTKATNSNDNVCDADCSLREAVFNADSGDTVVFSPSLLGQTVTLGGEDINITKRIMIDGFINNPNVAFISGGNTSRHFYVEDGAGLDLRNITLVQGNGKPFAGAVGSTEGGAIYVRPTATLLLERVSIRGNAADLGGAIFLGSGTHRFTNSSITGNSGSAASAIFNNGGALYISNVTISGNYTPDTTNSGHAIWNQQSTGIAYIRNSTIVRNTTTANGGEGGGIFNRLNGRLNIGNTIVAQNTDENGSDIKNEVATITSVGGNLIGDLGNIPANTFFQPKDIFGVNPLLAPINAISDGFPVNVHPLQAGSPARNGGINENAVEPLSNSPLTTDARGTGFPRIAAGTVDIGAFEDLSGNTSLIVSKIADTSDLVCDVDCSLREAVHQASLNFGTDTITFAPNVFNTITLVGSEILIKNQSVNIVGYNKASTLTVSGGNANRIFKLENATVNISGLTLADGGSGANGLGSAIYGDASNLTINRVMITRNKAAAFPALYLSGGTTQRVINSTISGNAGKLGVGIGIKDTALFMANTTISGNYDYDAGFGNGSVSCDNSQMTVRNSTVAYNSVSSGGSAGFQLIGCALNIGNSIVAQNQSAAYDDVELTSGSITSAGGNLIGDTNGFPAGTFSQTNDQTGINPQLVSLADNGGSVSTLALAPNSPAINTGVNANAVDPFDNSILLTDARVTGFSRIVTTVDKGAFEALAPTAATVTVSGRVIMGRKGVANARVDLTDPNGKTRTTLTNSLGYYTFADVPAGETYIFNAVAKRVQFNVRVLTISEDTNDLNFTSQG